MGSLWLAATLTASAQTVAWANWTAASAHDGTASGFICDAAVAYTGEVDAYTVVTNSAVYLWTPTATFTNHWVRRLPAASDIIRLAGGLGITNTLTFSPPVTNLVMLVTSLGSISAEVTNSFEFNRPFAILSQGGDYWKTNGAGCWLTNSGNALVGIEGSGALLFPGIVTNLGWTVPRREMDAGFTLGSLAPEPRELTLQEQR
jgi:hypothetical protein